MVPNWNFQYHVRYKINSSVAVDQKANVGKTISAVQEKQTPHCRGKERDERSTSALLCLRLPMSVNEVTYQGRYAVNVGPVQPCTPSTHTQTVT